MVKLFQTRPGTPGPHKGKPKGLPFLSLACFCSVIALNGCGDSPESGENVKEEQAASARFVPADTEYVVLESAAMPPRLSAGASSQAATPAEILQRSEELIARGSDQRDPRWFGYAETLLGKLLKKDPNNVSALLQSADVLQKQHQFAASESLYNRILEIDPEQAQPHLSLAMLRRQQGDFAGMESRCKRLMQVTNPVIASICLSAAKGLTGDLPAAYQRIKSILQRPLHPSIDIWARIEAAEMAARLDLPEEAEPLWTRALALASADGQPASAELLAAVADFYSGQGAHSEVVELLKGDSSPALLLRQAAAEIRADETGDARIGWQTRLRPWLKTWLDRGERTHDAELALYYHEVAQDQAAALTPALQQWRDRKEPQDLLLLLGILADLSSDGAKKADAVSEISLWMASSGYQDARATELMEKIK